MASGQKSSYPPLLAVTLLVVAGLFLWWNANTNIREFRVHQLEIAQQSTAGAANEITLMVKGLKNSVELLLHGHRNLLQQFAQAPDDIEAYKNLTAILKHFFPEYYAFTLAGTDGEILYDDFGERIGDLCRNDLHTFTTQQQSASVYIHPGPGKYHFDIMLPWDSSSARTGTFFISFNAGLVARLLRNSQHHDHQLLLVQRNSRNLIEISSNGSRDKLQRPIHLSPQEQDRILYSRPVEGTLWQIVDLPATALFTSYRNQITTQITGIMLFLLTITIFMLLSIRREEQRRTLAEQALQKSHDHLEKRVRERTRELASANEYLQHEINERICTEVLLRKLSSAVEQTDDIVVITNRAGLVEYVNPSFEEKTGYPADEVMGRSLGIIKSGQHDAEFYDELWSTILEGGIFRNTFTNRRKDGSLYFEEKTITPVKDEQGRITHYVATGKDITSQIEAQERLAYLAHHDVLTDLPNRALLTDRLKHALGQARRNNQMVAVLYLDLDRFKPINDNLGHSVGDSLLQAVAERLRQCIRSSDSIARLGGDEFTIVLEGIEHVHDVVTVTDEVLKSIARPYHIDGHKLLTTASIGITLFPVDDGDIESFLRNADTAMYRAKNSGGNSYTFFTADMGKELARRLAMEERLHFALERQEFTLHFQPRINAQTGRTMGAEALLRWQDPETGPVSPVEFIPLLEETGLIIPVGEWVLRTACRNFQAMDKEGMAPLRVSVNLSPRQFQQDDLVNSISNILRETGLAPQRLELEITESLLVDNVDAVVSTLHALHALGIYIAVDDFGTGYSALSYLKRFPLDTLKVDRDFVQDVTETPDDAEIVKAIVAMAHSLRLKIVAEGVETHEQLEFLRNLGCEEIQGYLFSRPLSLDDFTVWLRNADSRLAANSGHSGVV